MRGGLADGRADAREHGTLAPRDASCARHARSDAGEHVSVLGGPRFCSWSGPACGLEARAEKNASLPPL